MYDAVAQNGSQLRGGTTLGRAIEQQELLSSLADPPVNGTIAEKLAKLLCWDLGFHGQNSTYASHNIHAFAAKFPPQIPHLFIQHLTEPRETVLDPMMGSGTALVEAVLRGRNGVGFDLDPLAVRICRVKTTAVDRSAIERAGQRCIEEAQKLAADSDWVEHELDRRFDSEGRQFIDYWFTPATQGELLGLIATVEKERDENLHRLLELVFSSVIITKSGGVSLARDLAHTRPHRDLTKRPRSALAEFSKRLLKAAESIVPLSKSSGCVLVDAADARALPLPDETVDLVVTSPPYANAIDYMRAHKFSLVWLGRDLASLRDLRGRYVGSEKCSGLDGKTLPGSVRRVLSRLRRLDRRKADVLVKYFVDMRSVFAEMRRVLRRGRAAVVVVGNSTMRGMLVPTHRCLGQLGEDVGLELVGTGERRLDRNRRMMPASWRTSNSGIERRVHKEYVLGFVKA